MRILGYGEDALTLYVLQKEMGTFLRKVKEKVKEEQADLDRAVVYYRRSFGRRGGSGRSEFGEFDAIVSTERAIYLVETKWTGSTEWKKDGGVELKDNQLARHQIFQWYLEEWQDGPSGQWASFATDERRSKFQTKFGKTMPTERSATLVRNLEFILQKLGGGRKKIQNILLLVDVGARRARLRPGLSRLACPPCDKKRVSNLPDSFLSVRIDLKSVGGAGFVELQP